MMKSLFYDFIKDSEYDDIVKCAEFFWMDRTYDYTEQCEIVYPGYDYTIYDYEMVNIILGDDEDEDEDDDEDDEEDEDDDEDDEEDEDDDEDVGDVDDGNDDSCYVDNKDDDDSWDIDDEEECIPQNKKRRVIYGY